jgi:hypothetical protein
MALYQRGFGTTTVGVSAGNGTGHLTDTIQSFKAIEWGYSV